MKRMRRPRFVRVVLSLLAVAPAAILARDARAGGFYVPEVGPRAVGMAGAMTAQAEDPSAIFHNPAGLAGLDGLHLQLSTGLFLPDVTFYRRPLVDPNTGETLRFEGAENTNALIAAPFLGASWRQAGWTLGFAVYAPYGATLEFPAAGAQRQVVTGVSLVTVAAGPAVARELGGGWSVGLSLHAVFGHLKLTQANAIPYVTGDPEQYPDPDPMIEGTTAIDAKDPFTPAATAGVQWASAGGRVRVGASVLTPMTLELEGDALVVNPGIAPLMDGDTEVQPAGRRSDAVTMDLPLPLIARAGVAVKPSPRTLAVLDVNWQGWSRFQTLVVDFAAEHELLPTPGAYLYDIEQAQRWRDTWSVRVGGEWRPVAGARAGGLVPAAVRAGALYDQSPIGDRTFGLTTPDSDKVGVSAGLAWAFPAGGGDVVVDLAFMHLFVAEREVAPDAGGNPGSDGTILNKPAPSFFHGVTRAAFDIVYVTVGWRR